VIETFHDIGDLKFKVAAALKRDLGDGVTIPPLLPYRCDRGDQYDDISSRLGPGGGLDDGEMPLVFLIHGEESQALNKFVECLQVEVASLAVAPEGAVVRRIDVPWPTASSLQAFEASFTRHLARVLSVGFPISPRAVADKIDLLHEGLLIVHARVYTDEWSQERALGLRKFIDFWNSLTFRPRRFPVLILVTVEYREARGLMERFTIGRRNQAVRKTLLHLAEEGAQEGVALVRELANVKRFHAEAWAECEDVKVLVHQRDIRDKIADVFRAGDELAMRPLAKELFDLLRQKTA
jgi:hypothetical protein